MEKCDGQIEGPTIICTMNAKTKAKLKRDLRIREVLEIQRHNCGPGQGMNEDWGSYVKTTQWGPVYSGLWPGAGAREFSPSLSCDFGWFLITRSFHVIVSLFPSFSLSLFPLNTLLLPSLTLFSTMNYGTSNSVENLVTYLSTRTWFPHN